MVDSPELRSEFIEITVSPSATNQGFIINTQGPDDMADASVMAITEAQIVKKNTAVVHEYGVWNVVVPEHQQVMVQTLFGGTDVPAHYIDR